MDLVKEIVELISSNGLAITICAILLYFAFRFGNLGFDYIKNNMGIKKHDELSIFRTQIGGTIDRILERLMYRTGACRAYVFEFHNGVTSLGGLPFLKMTNTYEKLNDGATTEMHKRQQMAFELFPKFIAALYNEPYLLIDVDNRTEKYTTLAYDITEARGIKRTLKARIMDPNKKVIGYVGLDYCEKGRPLKDEDLEAFGQILIETSIELGALLSVSGNKLLKQKKKE